MNQSARHQAENDDAMACTKDTKRSAMSAMGKSQLKGLMKFYIVHEKVKET